MWLLDFLANPIPSIPQSSKDRILIKKLPQGSRNIVSEELLSRIEDKKKELRYDPSNIRRIINAHKEPKHG